MLLAHFFLWPLQRGGRLQGEYVKQDHVEARARSKYVYREHLCGWMNQAPLNEPSHLSSQRLHDNSQRLPSFVLRLDEVGIKQQKGDSRCYLPCCAQFCPVEIQLCDLEYLEFHGLLLNSNPEAL